MVAGALAQQLHLLGRALLGDPAVHQVNDDVALGQRAVPLQQAVRQPEATVLEQHRVVGAGGHGHGRQAALAQQGPEDPPVLVLVGAVPRDLRRQVPPGLRDELGDAAVLPAALRLAAGRDRAEEPERLVVVDDLVEDRAGGQHP